MRADISADAGCIIVWLGTAGDLAARPSPGSAVPPCARHSSRDALWGQAAMGRARG